MKIYLVGFMGCGKSTYGKKLAGKLKYSSVDLDKLVEEKAGKTVYEIFESEGEDAFRKLEAEALRETADLDNCVIATGGGAPAYWENMAWMNENGKAVFLKLFEIYLKITSQLLRYMLSNFVIF